MYLVIIFIELSMEICGLVFFFFFHQHFQQVTANDHHCVLYADGFMSGASKPEMISFISVFLPASTGTGTE